MGSFGGGGGGRGGGGGGCRILWCSIKPYGVFSDNFASRRTLLCLFIRDIVGFSICDIGSRTRHHL